MNWSIYHASAEAVEEAAEHYVLNHFTAAEQSSYEAHLLFCGRCQAAVETVDEFVQVFRTVLGKVPRQPAA